METLNTTYKKVSGVYKITNLVNGKFYIGSAFNLWQRSHDHKSTLKRNCHRNIHLQRAWNKYGESQFKFEVLASTPQEPILILEQWCIDSLNPHYNLARIAGNCSGIKRTEETKRKLSQARLGVKQSAETIQRRIASRIGVKQKQSTIEKRRTSLRKPLQQLDKDGKIIKVWGSFREAEKAINKGLGRYVASGQIDPRGNYWKYIR